MSSIAASDLKPGLRIEGTDHPPLSCTARATTSVSGLFAARQLGCRCYIRIPGRLEGHQVHPDRIEHFVRVSESHPPLRVGEDPV